MDVFEALADPTRREIVSLLAAGERHAGDIAGRFDIAGPSVSRHLKVLRESGLIAYRQHAQARIYRLEQQKLSEARAWMDAQLALLHARFDRLGEHLDRMKQREEGDAKKGAEAERARFIDHWTIEFIRTYPHPIERVWRAVTDPAEVAIWFIPPSVWELNPGGRYQFEEGFAGVVQAVEPMRLIRFGPKPDGGPWPGSASFFQFELEPAPGGTRLRYLQHADPDFPDPDELREGLASPGRPGALAGWHHAFEELSELLDGVPIGSRLPPTRLTEIVRNWAEMDMSAEFTAEQKVRILKGLRAREFHFELTDTYTGHVRAARPPAHSAGER